MLPVFMDFSGNSVVGISARVCMFEIERHGGHRYMPRNKELSLQ